MAETHVDHFLGQWSGANKLYFEGPPEPDNVSDSELMASTVAHGKFLSITYTWTLNETDHEGALLIGRLKKGESTSVAWVDSFHQSGKIMVSKGTVGEDGKVDVLGSYEAPPGPDWGWRIQLESDGDTLKLLMFNITPDGEEALAVDATYSRQ